MSLSSDVDETEKKTAYFVMHSMSTLRLMKNGWQERTHEARSKAEEEDDIFLCDFCSATGLNKWSFHFINKKEKTFLTIEDITPSSGNFML